jgi:hypothetical protein
VQAGETDTIIARFGREDGGAFQSLIELRTAKTIMAQTRSARRYCLIDSIASPTRTMELDINTAQAYSPGLFEFCRGAPSRGSAGSAVRDKNPSVSAAPMAQGIIETTGWTPGAFRWWQRAEHLSTKDGEVLRTTDDGNVDWTTRIRRRGWGHGMADAAAIPTTYPIGGAFYVEDGALKYREPIR